MAIEALASSSALPAFVVYDTISASSLQHAHTFASDYINGEIDYIHGLDSMAMGGGGGFMQGLNASNNNINGEEVACGAAGAGHVRKKRRRRQRSCKNKEEAENQRMTHIAVERNRRRLMNEHLAVLRSLMPESYIQRGDQASIVGGAIDFVKELEQQLQSFEVQKRTLQQKINTKYASTIDSLNSSCDKSDGAEESPFAQFFTYPQYSWCHVTPLDNHQLTVPDGRLGVADIEVTLIETHANLRILTARRARQLLKMVAGLQTLRLSVLHLNVTTLDSMVLYCISAKVEEGCSLTTVDDIASAVHHMLTLFEAEAASCAAV